MAGRIERCTPLRVSGWAVADGQPAELDVLIGAERVARIRCEQPRADLVAQGLPANSGFLFLFPRLVAAPETVSIRFPDGTDLADSPRRPSHYDGFLDVCTVARVAGWAIGEGSPVELAVLVNGAPIARIRCDRPRASFLSRGLSAEADFEFFFPHVLDPSDAVAVQLPDDTPLGGAPRHPDGRDGRVEVCTTARVGGWTVGESEAADLEISVNDVPVGRISCAQRYPDRRSNSPPAGAAFDFRFPAPIATLDSVSVRFPDGTQLQHSPCVPTRIESRRVVQPSRRIVVVLGMHRSGTSLCANLLSLSGVDMSDNIQVSASNQRGHWERPELVGFHDRVLRLFGRDWYDPRHALALPADWWAHDAVRAVRDEMTDWLAPHLRPGTLFGFKDPRTARLLPLWREIFDRLRLDPYYVFCVRHPAQVAHSLQTRDGIDAADGLYRWMVYNSHAIRNVGDRPVCIIPYEAWFAPGHANLERLTGFLDGMAALDDVMLARLSDRTIDRNLRHDDAGIDLAQDSPPRRLYQAIMDGIPLGRFSAELLRMCEAFIGFEQFVQPLLAAGDRQEAATIVAPAPLPMDRSRANDPRVQLARGLVTTMERYSEALREVLDELAKPVDEAPPEAKAPGKDGG